MMDRTKKEIHETSVSWATGIFFLFLFSFLFYQQRLLETATATTTTTGYEPDEKRPGPRDAVCLLGHITYVSFLLFLYY